MNPADLDAAAAAWTVFSTAYGMAPAESFVAALRSTEQLAEWPYDDPLTADGIHLLERSGRRAAEGDEGEALPALVADHRRLFVGPRPLLAAPWESVHRSREGLVFDVQTLQVRKAYRRFGLQSPLLNKEPDDHIALEAAFVANLALRALDALEEARDEDAERFAAGIREFRADHLDAWVPDLLALVAEHAETDYHRGMAQLTEGALAQLRAWDGRLVG